MKVGVLHPNYTWNDKEYDIGLVKLTSPLRFTDYIQVYSIQTVITPGNVFSAGYRAGPGSRARAWENVYDNWLGGHGGRGDVPCIKPSEGEYQGVVKKNLDYNLALGISLSSLVTLIGFKTYTSHNPRIMKT